MQHVERSTYLVFVYFSREAQKEEYLSSIEELFCALMNIVQIRYQIVVYVPTQRIKINYWICCQTKRQVTFYILTRMIDTTITTIQNIRSCSKILRKIEIVYY